MLIYAFTDLHGNTKALEQVKRAVKEKKPDLILFLGDLTIFERELDPLLSRVNLLGPPVLMLHGNHEEESSLRKASVRFSRITFLHKKTRVIGGFTFIGHGGGGFSEKYPDLEELAKSQEWRALDWERVVFMSHAPPYGTRLDDVGQSGEEWHVGSKTLAKLVQRRQPLLVLAGHIHDCFNQEELLGKTLAANPGPNGRLFDLAELTKWRQRR